MHAPAPPTLTKQNKTNHTHNTHLHKPQPPTKRNAVRALAASAVAPAPFKTDKSNAVFEEAKGLMPGGVSSPVRAFRSVGGNPIVFDKVRRRR